MGSDNMLDNEMSPDELLALATIITFSIAKGRSLKELRTILNLMIMVTANLNSLLAQYEINAGEAVDVLF
ncbi:hypothetical protein [Acetivibrio sp. MSJd-27]|uniref:hypothetical protein n=1 Tax=Acetivibrio sp. MSJd-27 TaxID=2841523 RepID=UPI0015B2FEF8|nr:hypothetical protein [Acetivibrio sp. MSJd-27]MBU5449360.1 hypothetical protein [Acetivibrio sp. MSJd-27]